MLAKAVNLAIAFFTLNKGVKANAQSIATEALDIGIAVAKIAKTQNSDFDEHRISKLRNNSKSRF